jgi:hypothetical protein
VTTKAIKEFQALPVEQQLETLAERLLDCAARAHANPLLEDSWVPASFMGASERLADILRTMRSALNDHH